jgi:hypothetical protein
MNPILEPVQMIEELLRSPLSLAIGGGILVTAVLGLLCGPFLDASVTVKFPEEFKDFKESEKGGGGKELGILERVLFFASAWLSAYVIAGAWLTFKVAAKWASWQHITKIPETLKDEDERKYMDARRRLSSRLLGRFLNGTLYNIFCAGMGWLVGKGLLRYSDRLPGDLWNWAVLVFIGVAVLIGRPLIGLPFHVGIKKLKQMRRRKQTVKNWR